MLLITLAALVALGQAPPLTKAEQLQEAARKGDAATVRKLVDEGVDVNTKFRSTCRAKMATSTWSRQGPSTKSLRKMRSASPSWRRPQSRTG